MPRTCVSEVKSLRCVASRARKLSLARALCRRGARRRDRVFCVVCVCARTLQNLTDCVDSSAAWSAWFESGRCCA
eukprot:1494111-Pyramimonas_sp.AAC.1